MHSANLLARILQRVWDAVFVYPGLQDRVTMERHASDGKLDPLGNDALQSCLSVAECTST